jgi:hypothetical protein
MTPQTRKPKTASASQNPRERWLGLTPDGKPARNQKPPSRKLTAEEMAFIEKEMPELTPAPAAKSETRRGEPAHTAERWQSYRWQDYQAAIVRQNHHISKLEAQRDELLEACNDMAAMLERAEETVPSYVLRLMSRLNPDPMNRAEIAKVEGANNQ